MFPDCCTGTGSWEFLLSRSGIVIGQRGKAAASAVVKVCLPNLSPFILLTGFQNFKLLPTAPCLYVSHHLMSICLSFELCQAHKNVTEWCVLSRAMAEHLAQAPCNVGCVRLVGWWVCPPGPLSLIALLASGVHIFLYNFASQFACWCPSFLDICFHLSLVSYLPTYWSSFFCLYLVGRLLIHLPPQFFPCLSPCFCSALGGQG